MSWNQWKSGTRRKGQCQYFCFKPNQVIIFPKHHISLRFTGVIWPNNRHQATLCSQSLLLNYVHDTSQYKTLLLLVKNRLLSRGWGAGKDLNPGYTSQQGKRANPWAAPFESILVWRDGSISDAIRRDLSKLSQANLFSNYFQKTTVNLSRKCVRSVLTV